MVSIAAFQAVDPGSIPGHRISFSFLLNKIGNVAIYLVSTNNFTIKHILTSVLNFGNRLLKMSTTINRRISNLNRSQKLLQESNRSGCCSTRRRIQAEIKKLRKKKLNLKKIR